MFAPAPNESAFLFDLRLRECLENPALLRSVARAVLVCASGRSDRELLRQLRLVAARVKPGGSVTLSYETPANQNPEFTDRLTRLAEFASAALASQCVKITALPASKQSEESAPLSPAWQRLQRLRSGGNHPTTTPATHTAKPPPATRTVITQTVLHQHTTQSTRIDWTP